MSLSQSRPRSDLVALSLLLFGFTLFIFWSACQNEFINLDDQVYLTGNKIVKLGFTWEGVKYAFTSGDAGNWHPITWLSHLTDVQCFGMDAGKHHLVGVVIHAVNAVLLLCALRLLTGSLWASAFVAAVFAWHPLRVESVVWASERKDLLAAFFGFLAILFYQRFVTRKAAGQKFRSWYVLTLLMHALSLMSKPMLVTLPCLLLLLDFWPLKRWSLFAPRPAGMPLKLLLVEKIPFLILTVISSIVTMIVQDRAGAVAPIQLFPMATRISNAILATGKYLQKSFWPTDLCPFYPYDLQPASHLIALSALLAGTIFILSWLTRRKFPFVAVGWLWFVGLLVPVIGLVQVGSQSMADRYTYLPTIGIGIAVTWSVCQLISRWPRIRWAVVVAAAVLLGRCGQLSQDQVLLWRDSETLFNHTLAVTKDNPVGHENVGLVLAGRGAYRQAAWHFSQALRIWPSYPEANSDLGLSLSLLGEHATAVEYARKAVELNPDSEQLHYNFAKAYVRMGSNDLARAEFERFLQHFPHSEAGTLSLAELYLADREPAAATKLLTGFTGQMTASDETYLALGQALQAEQRSDEAIATVQQVTKRNPKNDRAFFQLGNLLLNSGRPQEALAAFQGALQVRPAVAVYLALAEAQSALANDAAAIANYEKALELDPHVPGTLNNLAWLLAAASDARLRNGTRAVELGEKACELTEQRQPFLLGTLAAAYAEAGRFEDAVATAQKAIELAKASGQTELAARNAELRELYRAHKPYHEPAQVR